MASNQHSVRNATTAMSYPKNNIAYHKVHKVFSQSTQSFKYQHISTCDYWAFFVEATPAVVLSGFASMSDIILRKNPKMKIFYSKKHFFIKKLYLCALKIIDFSRILFTLISEYQYFVTENKII
ncbi:MAG: hypothetical protein FWH18_00640 [Marinilabiliaceae bacterium]|nr:hypothetical protein [Marinilabiliaceae bacterium]